MKKVFKLLLIVVCVFPLIVKADMSAPYIKQIDAIVTKKGGISVKDVQGKTKHFVIKIKGALFYLIIMLLVNLPVREATTVQRSRCVLPCRGS